MLIGGGRGNRFSQIVAQAQKSTHRFFYIPMALNFSPSATWKINSNLIIILLNFRQSFYSRSRVPAQIDGKINLELKLKRYILSINGSEPLVFWPSPCIERKSLGHVNQSSGVFWLRVAVIGQTTVQ